MSLVKRLDNAGARLGLAGLGLAGLGLAGLGKAWVVLFLLCYLG